jgi:hypothetical protein
MGLEEVVHRSGRAALIKAEALPPVKGVALRPWSAVECAPGRAREGRVARPGWRTKIWAGPVAALEESGQSCGNLVVFS